MAVQYKNLLLNGIKISRKCPDCGKQYSKWRWSPLWCPECDKKRVDRITEQLEHLCKSRTDSSV